MKNTTLISENRMVISIPTSRLKPNPFPSVPKNIIRFTLLIIMIKSEIITCTLLRKNNMTARIVVINKWFS